MSPSRSTRRRGSPWPWRRRKSVDPLRRLEQFNVATGSPQPDGRAARRRASRNRRRLAFWTRAPRPAQADSTASTPPPEGQRSSSRGAGKAQTVDAPKTPARGRRTSDAPAAPPTPAVAAGMGGRRSRRANKGDERARKSEERARGKAERAREAERAKEAERVRKEEERARRDAERAREAERAQEAERAKETERVRKEEEAARVKAEAERAKEVERVRKEEEAARVKAEAERVKAEERAREEAERVRKAEEAARAKEAERARKEQERVRTEQEHARQEQERVRTEAERARKEEEAARVKAVAAQAKEAERVRKEAERALQEAERVRKEEEAQRAKDEERARKEAERVRKEEEAQRAKDDERARKEAERVRKQEQRASKRRAGTRRSRRKERRAAARAAAPQAAAPAASSVTVATLAPNPAAPKRRKRRRLRRRGRQEQMELGIATSAPPGTKPKPPRRGARTAHPEPDLVGAAAVSTIATDDGAEQLVLVSADEQAASLTAPSTITNADLVNEAVAGLFSRPTRTILTVLGTMIGLTALVATLGLSRTANSRIAGRFDEIAATEVVVAPRSVDITAQNNDIPWDAGERLRRLNGVVAAGTLSKVDVDKALVRASPVNDPLKLSVQAASPSLFEAVRAKLGTGRLPDEGHSRRHDRVAVLGSNAAQDLGITDLGRLPAISIGPDTFLVIGIVDSVARQERLLSSVMIPEGTAREMYRLQRPDLAVIETAIGANALIADQAPIALRPDNAEGLKVTQQAELRQVRENVTGDLDLLFLMLGGVSLLVGAIGIANVTLVSVMERTGEIGLRRALGATRRHIARQFLLESTAMGFVGGILGASLGILIVVAVSALQGWSPVLDPLTPFAAPVIGGVIGLVAGSYPAHRAATMEPVEALRAGT